MSIAYNYQGKYPYKQITRNGVTSARAMVVTKRNLVTMQDTTVFSPVWQVRKPTTRETVYAALCDLAPSGKAPLAMMQLVSMTALDPRDIWEEVKALAYAGVIRLSGEWGAMLSADRDERVFLDSDGKPLFVFVEIGGAA